MLVSRVPVSTLKPKKEDARTQLATFLRDRRARLDPTECGFKVGRRRTPGLRREEVAQLAGVSVTWYTWLEQGRKRIGEASVDTLDGIAKALRLSRDERDHLFLLAQGRLPPRDANARVTIPSAMRRLLDEGLAMQPAVVRTSDTWDIVAWNRAAVAIFGPYETQSPASRNMLRRFFTDPEVRAKNIDWEAHARRLVAAFRGGIAKMGASAKTDALIAELSDASPEFKKWWNTDRTVAVDAEGTKRLDHPTVGTLTLNYASLTPESADGLIVTLFVPATPDDRAKVERLIAAVT